MIGHKRKFYLAIFIWICLRNGQFYMTNAESLSRFLAGDSSELKVGSHPNETADCEITEYSSKDITTLKNGDIQLIPKNLTLEMAKIERENEGIKLKPRPITIPTHMYRIMDEKVHACPDLQTVTFKLCKKWHRDLHEIQILLNGSVILDGAVLQRGTYQIDNDELLQCEPNYDYEIEENSTMATAAPVSTTARSSVEDTLSIIGYWISVLALITHLLIFCLVPSLRNLPGYNLASLSFAFLMAYCFSLIGLIPQVVGKACMVTGILKCYFFLVAFFCMNVMAFDVWKTLRQTTKNLVVNSGNVKIKLFAFYSLYSWGIPLNLIGASLIIENSDSLLQKLKPGYGDGDICAITNPKASVAFILVPAFTLFAMNGLFFILSAVIIKRNTMQTSSNDHNNQSSKLNYVLYVRLGIMMGITWLIAVLATAVEGEFLWILFSVVNSLQGLYVFLLFSFSKRTLKNLKENLTLRRMKFSPDEKRSSSSGTTKVDSVIENKYQTTEFNT